MENNIQTVSETSTATFPPRSSTVRSLTVADIESINEGNPQVVRFRGPVSGNMIEGAVDRVNYHSPYVTLHDGALTFTTRLRKCYVRK